MAKRIIRDAIVAELHRQDRTPYWLAQQIGCHHQSVYRMLDRPGMSTRHADAMLKVLRLRITPRRGSM